MAETQQSERGLGGEEVVLQKGDGESDSWDGTATLSEEGLHTLEEVEEMKRSFLRKMRKAIDTDEEYEKEMEEDRLADRKNGHYVDGVTPRTTRNRRGCQKNHPKLPAPSQIQKGKHASRPPSRVSAKVASYEAQLSTPSTRVSDAESTRVSGEMSVFIAGNEGRKRESMAAVTPNPFPYLHGDREVDSLSVGNTESRGSIAVRGGEGFVPNPSFAAKNIQLLEGTSVKEINCFNETTKMGVNAFNTSNCIHEVADMGVNSFNAINCLDENLDVNAFIRDKVGDSSCMVNTENKGSIRGGERDVPTPSIAAKNQHSLVDVLHGKKVLAFSTNHAMDSSFLGERKRGGSRNIKCAHTPNPDDPSSKKVSPHKDKNQILCQPFGEVNSTSLAENSNKIAWGSGEIRAM